MTRMSLFTSPNMLGFDHLEQMLARAAKASDGYPPYNIEKLSETDLRISLAVAGFSLDDLEITVEAQQLTIRGRQSEADDSARDFIHRGIAARQFIRSFVLADGMEVSGAKLEHGLLHVDLNQPIIEPKVKRIPIQGEEIELLGEPESLSDKA
ncbi:MAG: Hsp20 family protein [Alphaproteobacteria bacterium]